MSDKLTTNNLPFSDVSRNIDLQELKSRVDCRDVVRRLLGEPVQSTQKFDKYYSPFRDDGHKPAFHVYSDGVKDFGADGYSADVIGFVQDYLNCDFIEAIRYLTNEEYFHIQPVAQKRDSHTPGEPPSKVWQDAMGLFIAQSHERLMNAPDVLNYLQVERGLSLETIQRFHLGWNADWTDTGYRDNEGIVKAAPGVLIPWHYDGVLWAVRVRLPVGSFAVFMGSGFNRYQYLSENKYLSIRGSRQSAGLFGDVIQAGDSAVIVEGEFDAMLASERGPWKSITRGSAGDHANINQRWIDLLQTAETVFSLLDNDEAGQKATHALQRQLENLHPLLLAIGKDYTDFIIKHSGQPSALEAQAALWWLGTMPDSWRSAILNYMPPSAAPIIEMIHEASRQGCINPCGFTIDDLLDIAPSLGFDLSRSTVKRMVKETCGVFISKVGTLKSQTVETDSSLPMYTFGINDGPGRKSDFYHLNRLPKIRHEMLKWARPRIIERHFPVGTDDELLTVFESAMLESIGFLPAEADKTKTAINRATAIYRGENSRLYQRRMKQAERAYLDLEMTLANIHSYELPPAKISSAKDYRALFLRAQVEAGVNNRSQPAIAAAVGVSRGYVYRVQKHAGIKGKPQYETVVFSGKTSIRNTAIYDVKGFPKMILIDGNEIPYNTKDENESEQVAREAKNRGSDVQVRYQINSEQIIVRDDPLPVPKAAPQFPTFPTVPEPMKDKQMSFDDLLAQPDKPPEEILPEESPDEVEKPVKRDTRDNVTRIKPGKYFGTKYDPAWVYHQLVIALKVSGSRYRLSGVVLVDTSTGEVIRHNASERDLVAAILGETLEADVIEFDESLLEQLDEIAQ